MAASRNQLQNALHRPYDQVLFAKEVLGPVFGTGLSLRASAVPPSAEPNNSERAVIDRVSIYGSINLDDSTEVTLYEIVLQPKVRIEQSKVAIQRYVRKLLTAGQAALVNFVSPQNTGVWRLTLVAKDSELTTEGIKEKVTHAKRYTYLLGPNETCKTAAERFESLSIEREITFQSLINAYSVEKLSKAFFDEYTMHYKRFVEYLDKSNFKQSTFNGEEKAIRDFSKKLLGRIVFLYFVQKKGWLGASNLEYKDGKRDFMRSLFVTSGGSRIFYSNWLSPLFFETLNQERPNDEFTMPDGTKVKIPFLNGGLFDRDEHDVQWLTFEPGLFHSIDFEEVIPTKNNTINCRGFLDFLDAFNFTVHEDSPDEHTVAVDPEMLGHIFENLLEDNKDKGAFYTPKEIVHYMCQESLTQYLTTHLSKEYTVYKQLGGDQIELFGNDARTGQLKMMEQLGEQALNRDDVAYIVRYKDVSKLTKAQMQRIDQLLDNVKICDPAIGSGAFPMGLLQEIHAIKELVAYELQKTWRPAQVKQDIIQNSIYGVDIEKGAVDIARLRFWLSLVVDEEKPKALPNLDYKIVVGNSLVSMFEGEIVEIDWDRKSSVGKADELIQNIQRLVREIAMKQETFFKPETKNKKKLQIEIRNLKLQLLINQLSFSKAKFIGSNPVKGGFAPSVSDTKANLQTSLVRGKFDKLIARLQFLILAEENPFEHFDWKLDCPDVLNPNLVSDERQEGFDIVIGNPPYGAKLSMEEKNLYKIMYNDVHTRTPDTFNYFISKSFRLLKPQGVIAFIVPNNLLYQNEYTKTRSFLVNENYLQRVINLGDNTFKNADVPTCIFIGIKKQQNTYYLQYSDNRKELIENIDLNRTQRLLNKIEINEVQDLVIGIRGSDVKLMKDIELKSWKVDDIALEVASGISTGGDKIFRISKEFAATNNFEGEILKPVLVGGEIDKYKIEYTDHLIIYSYRDSNTNKLSNVIKYLQQFQEKLSQKRETKTGTLPWWCLHWHRYPALFNEEKIIMRQTSDSIRATYDTNGYYVLDSIIIFKIDPKAPVSYKYALIALNSRLNHFVYKNITQEEGRTFAQVKSQNVRKLFVPKIPREAQAVFETLCDYLMFLNNKGNRDVNPRIDNKALAHFFQQIADACIIELVYGPEMDEKKVAILEIVRKEITSFEGLPWEVRQAREIFEAHQKWTMPNSEVRNRMKIISLMCPDTAGKILNPNEED